MVWMHKFGLKLLALFVLNYICHSNYLFNLIFLQMQDEYKITESGLKMGQKLNQVKELSLGNKLKFSDSYIFST